MVLVTTTSLMQELVKRSTAGPLKSAWVQQTWTSFAPHIHQGLGSQSNGTAAIDNIIGHNGYFPDIANQIHDFRFAGSGSDACPQWQYHSANDRQIAGSTHTADVRRNHNNVAIKLFFL